MQRRAGESTLAVAARCRGRRDLQVLAEDGLEGLVPVHHGTEHQRFLGRWCGHGDPHAGPREDREDLVLLDVGDVQQPDDLVPLGGAGLGALEAQVVLRHVQNPVPDVVGRHLPVSVYQAAAPAVLTHCQRTLVLCQVKDFVEIALLGAMDAAGVLVLAQAGGRAGHVAPRGRRLQPARGGGAGALLELGVRGEALPDDVGGVVLGSQPRAAFEDEVDEEELDSGVEAHGQPHQAVGEEAGGQEGSPQRDVQLPRDLRLDPREQVLDLLQDVSHLPKEVLGFLGDVQHELELLRHSQVFLWRLHHFRHLGHDAPLYPPAPGYEVIEG